MDIEQRIATLLDAMTLHECAAQLDQMTVSQATDDDLKAGLGSIILASSTTAGNDVQSQSRADICNARQRVAIEQSRLGIPVIFGRDVIHGHHTVFPIPLGQAASWDPLLVQALARASAIEATADGVRWTFSPMLDICRDPRWGRSMEGYGESAHLTACLGVAAVQGYQGDNLSEPTSMAACAKHFAGYGASEGGRDYNTTEITGPTFRDVHLRPFEAAIKAGCATVMSSFNELGGLPSTANRTLLTSILRDLWGFDGFVVTDWGAVRELIAHGVAGDDAAAASLALPAGADMDMVDGVYRKHLAPSVAEGRIPESLVRQAVARVLRVKFRLGLFEQPYTAPRTIDRAPHKTLSQQAAAQCAVLLSNNGILPLRPVKRLAVVGPMAHATADLFGNWTLDGIASEPVSLAQALREQFGDSVTIMTPPWHDIALTQHGVHQADAAVVVMGETPLACGEANSVAQPGLPLGQLETLESLVALGTPIVLVIVNGRMPVLPEIVERCSAVLLSFHPGTEGARGLADVLRGAREPGGRLPVTVPRHPGQIPLYHDFKPTGRPLHEYTRPFGQKQFYRQFDCAGQPRYPFGFGLGYTTFELGAPRIEGQPSRATGIDLVLPIRNTGQRDGSTVIQVYLGDPVAELSQPVRRLAAFKKVSLAAGTTADIPLHVAPCELEYTHMDGTRRSDPGDFVLQVGQHRNDGPSLVVTLP